MDLKIIEKPLVFLCFYNISRKLLERPWERLGRPPGRLGRALGDPLGSLGRALGSLGDAQGGPRNAQEGPPGGTNRKSAQEGPRRTPQEAPTTWARERP